MIRCTIDDTGEVFNSLSEVAAVIGVSRQYVQQCKDYKANKHNHFYCDGYGITVLATHSDTEKSRIHEKLLRKKESKMFDKKYKIFTDKIIYKPENITTQKAIKMAGRISAFEDLPVELHIQDAVYKIQLGKLQIEKVR